MRSHDKLIDELHGIGFTRVQGKGRGVLERECTRRGEHHHAVVLVSRRDVTMLLNPRTEYAFKFQFRGNYDGAYRFIKDYMEQSNVNE